jgi:hypothetical protein
MHTQLGGRTAGWMDVWMCVEGAVAGKDRVCVQQGGDGRWDGRREVILFICDLGR